jgi:hypothetical protein
LTGNTCTQLVPGVDRSLGQIDKSSSGCVRQCHGQIVGLYLIVSSYSLDDCMIDLDEFFEIAGSIIFYKTISIYFNFVIKFLHMCVACAWLLIELNFRPKLW